MEQLLHDLLSRREEIDVWEVHFPKISPYEKELYEILDDQEKMRTSRFVFPHLTTRYTIGHASLRILLGRYAGVDPKILTFNTRVKGKPYLSHNPHQIEFNYSDSGDKALIGISIQDEIGIDIERINPNILTKGLENSIFTASELEIFLSHSNPLEAFYCGWTHKEAILKLLGTGLYLDLKKVEVPLNLATETNALTVEDRIRYLRSYLISNEYYAAIASNKPNFTLKKLDFLL